MDRSNLPASSHTERGPLCGCQMPLPEAVSTCFTQYISDWEYFFPLASLSKTQNSAFEKFLNL